MAGTRRLFNGTAKVNGTRRLFNGTARVSGVSRIYSGSAWEVTDPPAATTTPVVSSAATGTATSAATQVTVNKPTGVASGDLLVIAMILKIGSPTMTLAGWSQQRLTTTSVMSTWLFTRVADGTEASTFTVAYGSTAVSSAMCLRITLATGTASPGTPATSTSALTQTAPAITPAGPHRLLLGVWGYNRGDGTSPVLDAGMTYADGGSGPLVNNPGNPGGSALFVGKQDLGASSASTGTRTSSFTGTNAAFHAVLIPVTPAS